MCVLCTMFLTTFFWWKSRKNRPTNNQSGQLDRSSLYTCMQSLLSHSEHVNAKFAFAKLKNHCDFVQFSLCKSFAHLPYRVSLAWIIFFLLATNLLAKFVGRMIFSVRFYIYQVSAKLHSLYLTFLKYTNWKHFGNFRVLITNCSHSFCIVEFLDQKQRSHLSVYHRL